MRHHLRILAALLGLLAGAALAQTTITVPVPAGATSVTITTPAPTQAPPSTVFTTAPVVTPPPTPSSATVYNNGVLVWPGDYSYPGGKITVDYKNASCADGILDPYGAKVTSTAQWAGWLPYAPNWNYDLTAYGKGGFLVIDLKPSAAKQTWAIYAVKVGDLPITGPSRLVESYGPAPVAGKYATYKIPLADFMTDNGVQLTAIYKFGVQDKTGLASNSWCVNNVHFSAT